MKLYAPAVKSPVLGYVPKDVFVDGSETLFKVGDYSYPIAKIRRDTDIYVSLLWTELFGFTPWTYSMELERDINDCADLYISEYVTTYRLSLPTGIYRYSADVDRYGTIVLQDDAILSEYLIGHYYIDNSTGVMVRAYSPSAGGNRSTITPIDCEDISGFSGAINVNMAYTGSDVNEAKYFIRKGTGFDVDGKLNIGITAISAADKFIIFPDKHVALVRGKEFEANYRPIDHYVVDADNILSLVELMYKADTSTIHGMAKAIVLDVLNNLGVRIPDHPGMKTIGVLTHLTIGDVLMVMPNGSFFGITHQQYIDMYGMEP